jgi:hypothetical protein
LRRIIVKQLLFPPDPATITVPSEFDPSPYVLKSIELIRQQPAPDKPVLSEFYSKRPYHAKTIELICDQINQIGAKLAENEVPIKLYDKPEGVSIDTVRKDIQAVIRDTKHK